MKIYVIIDLFINNRHKQYLEFGTNIDENQMGYLKCRGDCIFDDEGRLTDLAADHTNLRIVISTYNFIVDIKNGTFEITHINNVFLDRNEVDIKLNVDGVCKELETCNNFEYKKLDIEIYRGLHKVADVISVKTEDFKHTEIHLNTNNAWSSIRYVGKLI